MQATKRLILLACLALVWAGSIGGRLVYLQVYRHDDYRKLAEQQQRKLIELRVPRGTILDRFERTLAMSQTVDSVCINPSSAPEVPVARKDGMGSGEQPGLSVGQEEDRPRGVGAASEPQAALDSIPEREQTKLPKGSDGVARPRLCGP
jgi:cell division protein FtsI/penicillin-binding protein 2